MNDLQYPDVLWDEDGHPSHFAMSKVVTAKQAVRRHFEMAYDGYVADVFSLRDINGDGTVYQIPLSEYKSFVADVKRVWMVKYKDHYGDDVWWPRGPGAVNAREYWSVSA